MNIKQCLREQEKTGERKHILVSAVAGAGKTTALTHAMVEAAALGEKIVCFVFDRAAREAARQALATELQRMSQMEDPQRGVPPEGKTFAWLRSRITYPMTMHSAALSMLVASKQPVSVRVPRHERDGNPRNQNLVDLALDSGHRSIVTKSALIEYMAMRGYVRDVSDEDLESVVARIRQVDALAARVFQTGRRPSAYLTFSELLHLTTILSDEDFRQLAFAAFGIPMTGLSTQANHATVFVDEAQDLNVCQLRFLSRFAEAGCRIVAVGDPRQAIYGWRGAHANSMTELEEILELDEVSGECSVTTLRMNATYRCPRRVVEAARALESDIYAGPGTGRGVVEYTPKKTVACIPPGALVLARHRATLLKVAGEMTRAGVRCRLDLPTSALMAVKKALIGELTRMEDGGKDKRRPTISAALRDLRGKLKIVSERTGRWARRNHIELSPRVTQAIDDLTVDLLESSIALLEMSAPGKEDANASVLTSQIIDLAVQRVVEMTTVDAGRHGRPVTILSTIHGAKGKEGEDVVIVLDERFPTAQSVDNLSEEERNLLYVAITRSRSRVLFLGRQIHWGDVAKVNTEWDEIEAS